MYTTQALFLFPLALPEPAAAKAHPQTGRDLQLQPRCLLYQIWWGNGHLSWWRWVSATEISVLYKTVCCRMFAFIRAPEKTHTFKKGKCYCCYCTTSHTVFGKLIVVTVTHLWKILFFFTFCFGYFVSKSNLQGKGQVAFYRKSASLSLWL